MLREGGAFYTADRHWLTATDDAELHQAVPIARGTPGTPNSRSSSADGVTPPRSIGGYRRTSGSSTWPSSGPTAARSGHLPPRREAEFRAHLWSARRRWKG